MNKREAWEELWSAYHKRPDGVATILLTAEAAHFLLVEEANRRLSLDGNGQRAHDPH